MDDDKLISSNSDSCSKKLKKNKKKKKEKRKEKKMKKDKDRDKRRKDKKSKKHNKDEDVGPSLPSDFSIPDKSIPSRNFAPMSKSQWEEKQKEVKKVLDEETGRYRLIRGDGEIIEEIVSKDRHKEINKQATLSDGAYFQSIISKKYS